MKTYDQKDWWREGETEMVSWSGTAKGKRCYEENHKPWNIGGGTFLGGNCGTPIVSDYDVYIGLDSWSYQPQVSGGFPWNKTKKVKGPAHDFLFPIKDMGVPTDVENFKKMISWIILQLGAKKKVHVGCIGGHGRTGLVLSAVAAELELPVEKNDVIGLVRTVYCKKAVESDAQITFLMKHYGVAKVGATKGYTKPIPSTPTPGKQVYKTAKGHYVYGSAAAAAATKKTEVPKAKTSVISVPPLESDLSIFRLTNAI